MARLSSSSRLRWVLAVCLFALPGWRCIAQPPVTAAEHALEETLEHMPEADARQWIANADASQITAGLSTALHASVREIANRNENSPKAVRILNLAAAVAQRGGFTLEEGDARFALGSPLINMGRIDEALETFNRAYDLFRRANATPSKLAGVVANRANANRHLGNFAAALDDNREAQKQYEQLGDEVGVARVLNNTGLVYTELGDFRRAMRVLQQSLEIAVRRHERAGEAYVLNNMAQAAMLGGDYGPAASYALRSLEIKEAESSREDVVTSLINLGAIYHHARRDADAERTLRRAISIAADTSRSTARAEALGQLGLIEFDRRNYTAAQGDFVEARDLYQAGGERTHQGRMIGYLARVLLARRDYPRALESANRARDMARTAGATPDLLIPALVAGQALRRLNRDAEARGAFEEAIATVEQMRDTVAGGDFERESFLAERSVPYREMTALEASQGHWTAALAMSERAKGRVLLDLLSGGRERPGRLMTTAEREREAQLRGRLAALGTQFRLVSAQPMAPPSRIAELRSQMDATRSSLDDFRVAFYSAHPELGVRRGDVQPIDWRAASALAADRNTAILDFASTPDGVYLFVIAQGRPLAAHRLAPSPAALSREVKQFREKLATRDPDFPDAAAHLYQTLLAPAAAELAGKTTWIVAPDADLWQVPFQALRAPSGRYLIEDAAVSYAPSLSVLSVLRRSRRPAPSAPSLAAFGNPTGDAAESESEVKTLAALYAPAGSAWIGAEATEDNFRRRAGAFDVIHVAAHGVFDDRNPLRSRLVFHAPTASAAQDGWLEAGEIRELDLRASLVVLSGCETARGNFEDGEGAIGMAWAFLAAGGHAVVASQWRVESQSTTQLMLKFHSALRSGASKAAALRDAKLDLLHTDRFRHPFYWAAFELFGDGN